MNLSWFKSSIKRYFEIDVNTIEDKTNNQIWLHQDSHLSNLHMLLILGILNVIYAIVGVLGFVIMMVGLIKSGLDMIKMVVEHFQPRQIGIERHFLLKIRNRNISTT